MPDAELNLWIADNDNAADVTILYSVGDARLILVTERLDHRVTQDLRGTSCTCRHVAKANGKPCVHIRALREVGLIR